MKKFAIGLSVFLALVVAAVLIGPSFIDWNQHADKIAAQVEKLTGRQVTIRGPISVAVLPRPGISVDGIELANMAGAATTQMASLDSLEVRVAAAPLLAGRVQIETIRLVRPVVRLERTADGRVNWQFKPAAAAGDAGKPSEQAGSSGSAGGSGTPPVAIDHFTIEDGEVHYLDAQRGREDSVTGINARVAAVSLKGPIESSGEFTVRGRRLGYAVNVAEIIQGRTVPLTAELKIADDASLKVDGSVTNVPEKPRLRAKVKGGGPDLGSLVRFLQGNDAGGLNLAKPFSFAGDVEADVDGAKLTGTEIKIDETVLQVAVDVATADKLDATVSVKSGWVDADRWMAALSAPAPKKAGGEKAADTSASKPAAANAPAKPAAKAKEPFALPKDVQAGLTVQVDTLVFKGKPIQGLTLNAELANGELTLSQLTAQLPGDADLGVFGFVGVDKGVPRFEGELESQARDLAPVIAWLAPGAAVPAGALKDFSFKTKMVIDQRYAQLPGINITAGGTALTGGITVALQARPSLGADLKIDRIDLDGLLGGPGAKTGGPAGEGAAAAGKPATGGGQTTGTSAMPSIFQPLGFLSAFDANVKLKVGRAVYGGQQIADVALDAVLQQGELTVNSLRVGNLAGIGLGVSGRLGNLSGIPKATNLKASVKSKNIGPAAKAFGIDLPFPAKDIGAVDLDATVNGSLLQPKIEAEAGAFGGRVSARGELPVLALVGKPIRVTLQARHGDLASLARRAGVDYTPSGKIGGLDLQATLVGTKDKLTAEGLTGQLGGIKTNGTVSVVLNAPKPKVEAALALGPVIVDPFLPAAKGAFLLPDGDGWRGRAVPAAWWRDPPPGLVRRMAVSRRWATAPIDLSALSAVDAVVSLTTPRLAHQGTVIENLDLGAVIDQGVLRVEKLTGRLAGGALNVKAQAAQNGVVAAAGTVSGLDLSRAEALLGGTKASGRVDASFDLQARGQNEAAIVSSLAGVLNVVAKDLDTGAASGAEGAVGVGGMMLALNQFAGVFGGPKKGAGLADAEAQFTVDRGVATTKVLKAVTNVGTATAGGSVDLAAWTVNLNGNIAASPSLLSTAFSIATRKGINVPFSVTGDLEKPRIRLDTASLGTGGVPIPGLDRLMKKKGVGDVLQGILGGGQPQPPAPQQPAQQAPGSGPPPQQAPQKQEEQQKIKPQDILRGILGGFGR